MLTFKIVRKLAAELHSIIIFVKTGLICDTLQDWLVNRYWE